MKQMTKTVYQTGNASTFTKCTVILLNSDPKHKEKYVWDCDEGMCEVGIRLVMAHRRKDEMGNGCRECVGVMSVKGQGMKLREE